MNQHDGRPCVCLSGQISRLFIISIIYHISPPYRILYAVSRRVTGKFIEKAVCLYVHGNAAAELYF